MFSSSFLLSMVAAATMWLLLPGFASADCGFIGGPPTVQELFVGWSSGEQVLDYPVVVRLRKITILLEDGSPSSASLRLRLPCPIVVVNEERDDVLEQDGFHAYEVMQVLKQNWTGVVVEDGAPSSMLFPGMLIPIVMNTDSGFYKDLPPSLLDDGQNGFLAFLTPYRSCDIREIMEEDAVPERLTLTLAPQDEGEDDNKGYAFFLDDIECNPVNQPWGDLSQEDIDFLQSPSTLAPGTNTQNSSDSNSSSTRYLR